MMYNKNVESGFFSPEHIGVLDVSNKLTAHFRSGQTGKSILIDLYIQCSESGIISRACFKARGNPYVIAACEFFCVRIEGESLYNLSLIDYQIVIKQLEIPLGQYPIALQVEDAFKEVLALLKYKFEG